MAVRFLIAIRFPSLQFMALPGGKSRLKRLAERGTNAIVIATAREGANNCF
jgi:hypothetical protein